MSSVCEVQRTERSLLFSYNSVQSVTVTICRAASPDRRTCQTVTCVNAELLQGGLFPLQGCRGGWMGTVCGVWSTLNSSVTGSRCGVNVRGGFLHVLWYESDLKIQTWQTMFLFVSESSQHVVYSQRVYHRAQCFPACIRTQTDSARWTFETQKKQGHDSFFKHDSNDILMFLFTLVVCVLI